MRVERRDFSIPAWTVPLPVPLDDRHLLLKDILSIQPDRAMPGEPAYHTDHLLAMTEGPHWQRFRSLIEDVVDTIANGLGLSWSRRRSYLSGISYQGPQDYPRKVGHTHIAATFVAATPIAFPPGDPAQQLGTMLRNPLPSTSVLCGTPLSWTASPAPWVSVVYLGTIEHRPELPEPGEPHVTPRVILSADVCYF